MKWYFLIVGILGAHFTDGWSLALGVLGWAFATASNDVHQHTSEAMQQATSPVEVAGIGFGGALAILALALVTLVLMLAVAGAMVEV